MHTAYKYISITIKLSYLIDIKSIN